jgi:hypothetical protein
MTDELNIPQTDPAVKALMIEVRDKLIAHSLRNDYPSATGDLRAALDAQAARYESGDMDRSAGWCEIKDRADRADLAYCAYCADRADRAYLAYCAYCADRADRAYLADRADRAVNLLGDIVAKQSNLDASVLAIIEAEPDHFDMGDWGNVCGTTHCRGGHAVMLQPHCADLVEVFGWAMAARIVYLKCTGAIPEFYYQTNAEGLASIRHDAGV